MASRIQAMSSTVDVANPAPKRRESAQYDTFAARAFALEHAKHVSVASGKQMLEGKLRVGLFLGNAIVEASNRPELAHQRVRVRKRVAYGQRVSTTAVATVAEAGDLVGFDLRSGHKNSSDH